MDHRSRGVRFAIVAVAVVAVIGCKESRTGEPKLEAEAQPKAERSREEILNDVNPQAGFHYFATDAGNHPTLFLDRENGHLVVVGRAHALGGTTKEVESFPPTRIKDALAAYYKVLIRVGYQPAGAPPKKKPDPNAMVAIRVEDLLGSGPSKQFPAEQGAALFNTRPLDGWAVFSGFNHPTNDAPSMGASGSGLHVMGPGVQESYEWDKSDAAFRKFTQLAAKPSRTTTQP